MNSRIDHARIYMRKLPLAISGQGGHDTTLYVACELVRRFSVNEEELFLLLREYNEKLATKWTEKELRHKAASALKKTQESRRAAWPGTRSRKWFKPLSKPMVTPKIEWEVVPRPIPVPPKQEAENCKANSRSHDPAVGATQSYPPA